MDQVFRVVDSPAVGKVYRTRQGAKLTAAYWRKRGHERARVQGSPVIWSELEVVPSASANPSSSEGEGGGNAARPLPTPR